MNIRRNPENRIGEKINAWTIIAYHKESRKFTGQCKCGFETKKNLCNFKTQQCCQTCKYKDLNEQYIGKKFNKLTVIGSVYTNRSNKLKVKCQCGNEYLLKPYQLKYTIGCCKCKNGLFPGKIIDGLTLLEYLGDRKYKIKCHCGNIFETTPKKYLGKYVGCGCSKRSLLLEEAQKKVGLIYGNFKVKKVLGILDGNVILELKCKCGNTILRKNGQIYKSKSCGCLDKQSLPKGEKASNAKLKNVEVIAMRELYDSGEYTVPKLMEMYDLPYSYVRRIVTRKIWKNI